MMEYRLTSRRKADELKTRETVRILALETSCDETAAAVRHTSACRYKGLISPSVMPITWAPHSWAKRMASRVRVE